METGKKPAMVRVKGTKVRKVLTGCEFEIPQNARRLINVYAIHFMP
jgi:hypothetical protein